MSSLPLILLILIFVGAAVGVWFAGIRLSEATDVLSKKYGLGQALGGLILLSIATNLPEIAITASGALKGDVALAVGNILGGIALQTVVLVALDAFGLGKKIGLTYSASSLELVIEGVAVIAILTATVMSTQLPSSLIFARVTPGDLAIVALWLTGLWLVNHARTGLPWQDKGDAPGGQDSARGDEKKKNAPKSKLKPDKALWVFGLGAVVTLVCGVLLEMAGDAIAKHLGMTGVLFGATVLAAATSLPELSTGLASMKLGDHKLAISDIFGGNAFLPTLFLMATLLSGKAVLPHAQKTDIYLTGLGMLLTSIYITGLIFRPKKQIARMGIDSLAVLIVYIVGIIGLFAIGN